MKKNRKWFLLLLIPLLVVIYIISLNTSFKRVALDDMKIGDVTSIDIVKTSNNEEITIEDANQIEQIMKNFSDAKLRKYSILEQFDERNFNEAYWITIKVNGERKFGIRLDNDNYLSIHDYSNNKNTNFKITNNLNLGLENLFK